MWGALFTAWGILALRPPRLLACVAAVVLAAASGILGVLFMHAGWWQPAIACALGGWLGVAVGLWGARRLVIRKRAARASAQAAASAPTAAS
jgi:hypothetical protein